jgi:hypothetical protein
VPELPASTRLPVGGDSRVEAGRSRNQDACNRIWQEGADAISSCLNERAHIKYGDTTMFSLQTHGRSADAIRDRYQAFFDNAFMPQIRHEQMPAANERVAYAAEFAAYQLGQINDKLGRLVDLMEPGAVRRG